MPNADVVNPVCGPQKLTITDDQLKRARAIAAEIITAHSDRYGPLFDLLDQELQRREKRRTLVRRCLTGTQLTRLRAQRRKRRRNLTGRDGQS